MDLNSLIPSFQNGAVTIVAFIVALSIIVAIHEYGHYIVGRWSGIHAEVFSLGFGPVIYARVDKRGTKWQIAAIPLGGYVRFKGDANAAMVSGAWEASDPYGIYHQSKSLVHLPDDFMQQIFDLDIPKAFIYGDQNLPENNNGEIWPDSPETETLSSQGIQVGVVPNSGHIMMIDNLEGFVQAIVDVLSKM